MDEPTRLGELIHDSLINHTGSARTMGSFHVAEDVLAAGYVRLDGINVERLRLLADRLDRATYDDLTTAEIRMLFDLLSEVLAALDGETS